MNRYDQTKNSEGYRDPTPYEALQKQARNQIKGKQSRIAGEHFENMISAACSYYKDRGLAHIEKTPEPMKPLRAPNRQGQFLACFTKAAQPDYKGTLKGGRAVVFEAKHTDDEKIERRRLTQEQLDGLEAHHRLGALAFVLVSIGLTDFYRVPWTTWRDMADIYGRQYIKHNELEPFEVPAIAGYIKLLDGIDAQLKEEKS